MVSASHDQSNPTEWDFLKSLPVRLRMAACVTMIAYWRDAGCMTGPTELSFAQVRNITRLSYYSQQLAIRELEDRKLLSKSELHHFANGVRRLRIVHSPLALSSEGGT